MASNLLAAVIYSLNFMYFCEVLGQCRSHCCNTALSSHMNHIENRDRGTILRRRLSFSVNDVCDVTSNLLEIYGVYSDEHQVVNCLDAGLWAILTINCVPGVISSWSYQRVDLKHGASYVNNFSFWISSQILQKLIRIVDQWALLFNIITPKP